MTGILSPSCLILLIYKSSAIQPASRRVSRFITRLLFLFGSCSESETVRIMDRAESLMEEHPDSALNLLTRIDGSAIGGRKEQARHALLMSMALDKNYIDTTTFDVLQPAIDYYRAHGNPDEKLRTYYYQGRIYQNHKPEN